MRTIEKKSPVSSRILREPKRSESTSNAHLLRRPSHSEVKDDKPRTLIPDRLERSSESRGSSTDPKGIAPLMKGLEQNFGGDTRGPDHLQTRGGYGSAGSAGSSGTSPSDPEQERTDEALESLDQHFDVFDNPGGGNTDGVVSLDDLRDVATGEFDQDKARERLLEAGVKDTDVDKVLERLSEDAGHLLEQEDLLSELVMANDTGEREEPKISLSEMTSNHI